MRSICGVMLDLDLPVKPIRLSPYHMSPAKTQIAKELIGDLCKEQVLKEATSEWGFPCVIVPKPGEPKPGQKKEWRLCTDLRKLNATLPHDTYEPPTCDACLEWLTQRPCRSCLDLRWGFYGCPLSERFQRILTMVTPFGTYSYQRLVMGFINSTAEFQRHVNHTLGNSLWKEALAMVDDVIIANDTLENHRASMLNVFTKLARRQHCIKASKMSVLQSEVKYLGHISTEYGLKPTEEHVKAITEMPYPAYENGNVNITSLRSFIGMVKYLRRYIKNCAKYCMVLNELLTNQSAGRWEQSHAAAWDALKQEVAVTKGAWHVNYHHPIYVCTDGSQHGIGGYMYQIIQ